NDVGNMLCDIIGHSSAVASVQHPSTGWRALAATLFPYTTLFRSTSSCRRRPPRTRSCCRSLRRTASSSPTWRVTCIPTPHARSRSEEHTSELQSLRHLVCRLLLEKKNV